MRLLVGVALLAACSHAPVEHPAPVSPAAMELPMRLVDRAAEAEVVVDGGDLDTAFAKLGHPLVSPSPLPGRGGFPRALQVAFAEPELTRLLGGKGAAARPEPTKIDLTWNRTRGIYEAREALFVPAGARYRYTLPPGPAARLRAEIALPPGGAPLRLSVSLDGKVVETLTTTADDAGRWRPISIDLPARDAAARLELGAERGHGALFLGAPIVAAQQPPADTRPNILFVLVDTLRADALPAMPKLSAYAAGGARFSQAITTATWTRPSLIGAFGGDLPTRLGHSAEDMIPSDRERRRFRALHPPLLPRRLAAAGYETRAIGNNFFLLGFPRIGLDLGIDAVTDVRHPMLDTPAITAEAIRYLRARHDAPFFLYLHYDAPHWPYTPPPASLLGARGKHLAGLDAVRDPMIDAYLGETAYADAALGDVFAALEASGHASDTIVVVVGDHGEVFDPAHAHVVDALGLPTLHHHGWSAYDEIGRVPLVVRWPGQVTPRVVDVQTSLVDLAPTLAELAGLGAPVEPRPLEPTRGRSLATALRSPAERWPEEARPALIEGQNVRALRADGWLYLLRSDGRLSRGTSHTDVREELYELSTDPLQHQDRVADPLAPLARMRARFAQSAPALPPFAEPVLHLALAEDERAHLLSGEIRCPSGHLAVHAIERGRVEPSKRGLSIELEAGGRVDLIVDPPDAAIEVALRRDQLAVDADHLLVGPLALPLYGGRAAPPSSGAVTIAAERLSWLDAGRAPELGRRGEVVLWRDPGALSSGGAAQQRADGEVATMMQRWGYAQPAAPAGKK